ncbi:hypothetical protein Pan97_17730 [Bremerella volcania]|uniref:Uncharacterized protein n=1 Tax=Bremerella volcania TaxID=2527984 RepID=A0A518C6A3_9BACT|nr:hypothetical protein [Bremerella volcania]QDU74759.1 hypothetical protein Pan97_17730 [Bremerella volcania]
MEPQLIQTLLDDPSQICVSIYMPMFRWGREVQQNEIRYKNLMKDTATLLQSDEVCDADCRKAILKRLEDFGDDETHQAWRHPSAGLALFVTPDSMQVQQMGCKLTEQVHVGERFYLRPLLPALHGDGRFVLIAVSHNHVRLFDGNADGLEERVPAELPENLKDALNIDDYMTSIQHFSYAQGNDVDTMYHGQGAGEDDHKQNILQFFHRIDAPLNQFLEGRNDPLIFAGVEYLYPIFKEAISYPNLLPESVHGNFDDASADELHEKAQGVVRPYFQQECERAISNYQDAYGQNRATNDLETILRASEMGAVEALLIREDTAIWGHVDQDGHVQNDGGPSEVSHDLLDDAAVETLKNGGDVFVVREADFPEKDCAAVARLRFEIASPI